jgi:hypothetical protein
MGSVATPESDVINDVSGRGFNPDSDRARLQRPCGRDRRSHASDVSRYSRPADPAAAVDQRCQRGSQ